LIEPQKAQPGRAVLVVEDASDLSLEIITALKANGFEPATSELSEVAATLARQPFDLIVMDRMLHGIDSLSIVPGLRASGMTIPIIFVSFLSSVDEKILGLRAGGDDYLIKPFAMGELIARAEALVRRNAGQRQTSLVVGDLVVDLIERTVRRGTRTIDLLPREFRLLEYLMRHDSQVVSRAMLLKDVWHYNTEMQTNVVDAHITNLRKKINAEGEQKLIRNVRGAGYIFSAVD
jgi:two-component system OmpR family response regulator